MPPLRDRPTADLIVLSLTFVVGFIIIMVSLIAVGGVVTGHASDVKELIKTVSGLISSLIAVIVGYIGGRGAATINGNGHKPPNEQG